MEIRAMAAQSVTLGHSPSTGIPISPVITGVKATKAAPLVAPSRLTIRPYSSSATIAVRRPWTTACNAISNNGALKTLVAATLA
jgi:hypothetical protein